MDPHLICIPFAYEQNMRSGVNFAKGERLGNDKLSIYLKNACVALLSAKHYNPDCDIAFATNLSEDALPPAFVRHLKNAGVLIFSIPFDQFRFADEYPWALAFYKLCVLKRLAALDYAFISYLDTDVYIQGSFAPIWQECRENILLYDINHGLNTNDYTVFCKEAQAFLGQPLFPVHYGGEFFAASRANARSFCAECDRIYQQMCQTGFVTSRGDEFILSLAANRMRASVKNAGAYIYRFWTGPGFRLVSTCYEYNRVTILHLPAEKERGMLKLYERYIRRQVIPKDRVVWRLLRLSHFSLADRAKRLIKKRSAKKSAHP